MILLMLILNQSDKYTSSQVYLHKDKLMRKDKPLNNKRRLTFIMKRRGKISIFMVKKEDKNLKSSQ